MKTRTVDVAIIGAGTAGLTARRSAQKAGADIVLIDPGPYGTTCARVGCMPSKLLISAADAAHHARHADVFGVHADVRVDGREVMARLQRERDRFAGFVVRATDSLLEQDVLLPGRAHFVDAHTLEVAPVAPKTEPTRVEARAIVIATGSTPFVPPPYQGLSREVLLTTDEVFEQTDLPDSLLVVGAGVIGMELGQAFHRLGVRTTILSLGGRVALLQSDDVNAEAVRVFREELDLHPEHTLHSVEEVTRDDGSRAVRVHFTDFEGTERTETYAKVLMGAGRTPNYRGLSLENTGLPLDKRGRPSVNPYTNQVGDSHIFVAGDVAGHRPLLHEAADEGRQAGHNAAHWPDIAAVPRKTPLAIVFTDPQIAIVGRSWDQFNCDEFRVGEVDYGDQGRARVMNQHKGLVRIAGEAGTGLLMGAQMLGPRVEHTAHLLAWAIQSHMRVGDALKMPFYHPVVEEGIRTAMRDLQGKLHLAREPGRPCEEWGAGS